MLVSAQPIQYTAPGPIVWNISNLEQNKDNIYSKITAHNLIDQFIISKFSELQSLVSELTKTFIDGVISKFDHFNFNSQETVHLVFNSFIKTISNLLSMNPERLGLEVTNEGTLYYNFKKQDFDLHIETHFYYENLEDDLVVSLFKNDEPRLNIAGSLNEVFPQIKSFIKPTFSIFNGRIS